MIIRCEPHQGSYEVGPARGSFQVTIQPASAKSLFELVFLYPDVARLFTPFVAADQDEVSAARCAVILDEDVLSCPAPLTNAPLTLNLNFWTGHGRTPLWRAVQLQSRQVCGCDFRTGGP